MPAPWFTRLTEVLGPVGATRPLGANIWAVTLEGRTVVAKIGPGCPDESDGLRRIGQVEGAPPVPEVLYAGADLLVMASVDPAARTVRHDESLGRALARLHQATLPYWGGGSSWIGTCSVDPSPQPDGAAFYGDHLSQLAARCGMEDVVNPVVAKFDELLPPGGPAILHGDLWWGNVLFGADGQAWLIDPSVHGGHPEEDLAMLALFGDVPDRLLGAYCEVQPLHPGWQERIALFQLYPLLVHTVLFGGGYRAQVLAVTRRFE